MNNEMVDEFTKSFDEGQYPVNFLQKYELIECLAHTDQCETFLIREYQTNVFRVAKCYTDNMLLSGNPESELLKDVHSSRLPALIDEFQSDGMLCVVREYVEGVPLNQYVMAHPITKQFVISTCVQICDDLASLHGHKPPIIHRDIKPQNIIIDREGNPHLIDFGNSRVYDENDQTDTVCFGTRHFAAPEQYGFAQTDSRTDIFALGVLLAWLLSGETEVKLAIPKIRDRQLVKIIKKCTAFDPNDRYPSTIKVKRDLLHVLNQTTKKAFQWTGRIVLSTMFILVGFILGRYTDFSFGTFNPGAVQFKEPLVEQAVRLELGKGPGDAITGDDLLNVTEIYIYGNHALSNSEEFKGMDQYMASNDPYLKNGGMTSLEDLTQLINLRILNIAYENISDLSPLEQLPNLEQIQLKHNPIEDVSPLSGMAALQDVSIYETRVSDFSPLTKCPRLEKLNVGKTRLSSLSDLSGMDRLTFLDVTDDALESLHGIEEFEDLQELRLTTVPDGDLTPLLSLPQLKVVHLSETLRDSAETSLQNASFEIQY